MKLRLAGALLGALLAPACAVGRVDQPPAPPAFDPASSPAAAAAPAAGAAATQTPPAPAPKTEQPQKSEPAQKPESAQTPAAAPGAATAEKPSPPTGKPDEPLGWIAGQPLQAEELLLEWGDASSRELWLVLDKLVASRLAVAEAERLGIRLAPEAVEARYTSERGKLEEDLARDDKARGKERTLEEFIEGQLGFDAKRYLERVRRSTIRQMLAERAVRAASLAGESVALRLIVASADQVESVKTALASGRDFGDVARELSLDESKKNGGLVPFVVPEERSPLARLAFQTPVGETAGPLPVADHQFWIRVEERRAPVEGNWDGIEAKVEETLAKYPVGDAEFVHWKLAMERRYPIDLGPLWSLIGAAR